MIFEEFDPKIHDYHKVAEFIYAVDFRTYEEVFKSKDNAIAAIEDLLLVETEDIDDDECIDEIDRSNSKLYVVLDNTDFEDFNSNNNENNSIRSIQDKYTNSIDISINNSKDRSNNNNNNNSNIENNGNNNSNNNNIDINSNNNSNDDDNNELSTKNVNNPPRNIIGMLQVVKGKKESLFGDILYVMTKLKSIQALRFSYIYFLDSLVLANLNEDDLYIAEIAIDECKRGKGLGTKIIKRVIEKAKEKGFKRVVLDTDLRNTGAAKLYESIGFKKFDKKSAKFLKKERGMYNMEYIL